MKSTRQHLNTAALGLTKLLTMITRMPDTEIDAIIEHNDAITIDQSIATVLNFAEHRIEEPLGRLTEEKP